MSLPIDPTAINARSEVDDNLLVAAALVPLVMPLPLVLTLPKRPSLLLLLLLLLPLLCGRRLSPFRSVPFLLPVGSMLAVDVGTEERAAGSDTADSNTGVIDGAALSVVELPSVGVASVGLASVGLAAAGTADGTSVAAVSVGTSGA